jgi:tetratricopeptide (TPR) repeat protein
VSGRRLGWAVVLWAALACPREGAAVEDGGTRSPLASGAGSRALALGGAFVAIAEDAGALGWNPAGLALATRTGFEVSHDQRSDLGSSLQHAALVLPSWRWGAAAIGVHHLGVAGIEQRDDRNVVVEGELTGGETEIALGYARALGEAWSLGGAVKLQSQNLAGFSASALAADAGLRVALGSALGPRAAWMEGLSFGLSIRNLLEPALRLDRESVRDPRVWRTGLGWRGAVAGARELVVGLDVDGSDGVAARLHAGAELRLLPLLALRAGLDDGRPTAGAGVRWRDLEVSYAFEDVTFTPVHRVGLSHSFGPTVSARRAAAREAEEQAIQARLDEEFLRRRNQQLADLLGRAEEALGRRDFATSLDLLSAAATLDSADARIRALEARTQLGLGLALEAQGDVSAATMAFGRALSLAPADSAARNGEARCRARLDRLAVRDAGRKRAFQAALDALANGDLATARSGFVSLVASDSTDTESRAMLGRTQDAIARQVGDLLRQARRGLELQRTDEARQLLSRARALDPRAAGLDELWAALSRAPRPSGDPSPPPAKRPIGPAERREAEEMFRRGTAAMSAGRSDDAVRYWELTLSIDTEHPGAARYLNGEYLVRGMEAHAAGHLEEAIGYWEKARRADPKDPRASGFLARARERQERTRVILGENR